MATPQQITVNWDVTGAKRLDIKCIYKSINTNCKAFLMYLSKVDANAIQKSSDEF